MNSISQSANKDSEFIIKIDSCGPYLTSYYLQIMQDTNLEILWKRFSGIKRIKNKYENCYENINLGNVQIKQNDILDINEKFSPCARKPYRSLKINDKIFNYNNNGTSSDIYIITFTENTKYIKYTESYVDK